MTEAEAHAVLLELGGDIAGNCLSKLFLTIAAAFAEAERDRIRERVAHALESVSEQQVAIIRRAGKLRAAGPSLRAVRTALQVELGARVSLHASPGCHGRPHGTP